MSKLKIQSAAFVAVSEVAVEASKPTIARATLGSFFTPVSAEEHHQIVEYSCSGNTKSKGVVKVPLKQPV